MDVEVKMMVQGKALLKMFFGERENVIPTRTNKHTAKLELSRQVC